MTLVSQDALIAGAIANKVVSFPTDTVPALAVRPENSELIFTIKERSVDKPLILMAASWSDLQSYVIGTPTEWEIWQQVVQQHLPGSLTLVLPASASVPAAMNPSNPTTIGVRIPNCDLALGILSQTGALATTSANRSGESPLRTTTAVEAEFPNVLALDQRSQQARSSYGGVICDSTLPEMAEKQGSGVPSTVAKWTGAGWEILRQGGVQLNS